MSTNPAHRHAPGKDPAIGSAREAGLRYVSDTSLGIRRVRSGKHFRYVTPSGTVVHDVKTLARIRSLVIPPAWKDVWICADALGHIQATGQDARGRKQYRYHQRWKATRSERKFHKLIPFSQALPRIRRRVRADLACRCLCRNKVVAAVVELLERTMIRIGNEEYVRENHSYGLTTMHDCHVRIHGERMLFCFRGKSGKSHRICVRDRHLARIVQHCQDMPGQHLFEYCDASGCYQRIESAHVNTYLQETAGGAFTAKDYRTWKGTMLAAQALAGKETPYTKKEAHRQIIQAVCTVAAQLGNTPAVCRMYYIHPAVFAAYQSGALRLLRKPQNGKTTSKLSSEERDVVALLRSFEQRDEKLPNQH